MQVQVEWRLQGAAWGGRAASMRWPLGARDGDLEDLEVTPHARHSYSRPAGRPARPRRQRRKGGSDPRWRGPRAPCGQDLDRQEALDLGPSWMLLLLLLRAWHRAAPCLVLPPGRWAELAEIDVQGARRLPGCRAVLCCAGGKRGVQEGAGACERERGRE